MQLPKRAVGLGIVAAIGTSAIALAAPAGAAGTQNYTIKFTVTCPMPIVGNVTESITTNVTAPVSVVAGSPLTLSNISYKIDAPAALVADLSLVGVKSVIGSLDSTGTPQTTMTFDADYNGSIVPVTFHPALPSTPMPATGDLIINGTMPDQTFPTVNPGTITMSMTSAVTAGLRILDANGNPVTSFGLTDPIISHCTVDAGQNMTLGSVTVTAPPAQATTTTTTLTATPASGAKVGDSVTLSAAVATADSSAVAGTVEFKDGSISLGTAAVSGSSPATAALHVTSLAAGSHSLTAAFTPTDATKQSASTSAAVPYSVSAGTTGGSSASEQLNVTVGSSGPGSLVLSIPNNSPVQFSAPAAISGNPAELSATARLNPVTVTDTRSANPGWTLSGQVGDFSNGSAVIPGGNLGWTPSVVSSSNGQTVTAGAAALPGSGSVKSGATLASAAAGVGVGAAVIGAGLSLNVPVNSPAGTYGATLTVTVV